MKYEPNRNSIITSTVVSKTRVSTFTIISLFLLLNSQTQAIPDDKQSTEAVELEPFAVVSTGTRTQRLQNETPIKTEILGPELFLSAGTRDIAAALEYMPGIRSEANCQNCGTAEIKMLGLGAGYNQLLFDSQPLFSGLASVYGIEQIPTAFIGRIEVLKNGASSLYGPGAVAGVINILPNEPVIDRQRYDLSLEDVKGSTFLSTSFVRDWASDSGNTALSIYGQFNNNESVDLNDDGFTEITEKQFYTLGTQAWIYPSENSKISINYSYSWEERRGGNALERLPHESQITEELTHNWHRGGIFWEGTTEESEIQYRLGVSTSYVDRDSYYGGVGNVALPEESEYNESAYLNALEESKLFYGYSKTLRYFYDSFFSKRFKQHELSWGSQYQIDTVFDEKRNNLGNSLLPDGSLADFKGEDPIADGSFSNLGFFLQDEWLPTTGTTFIAGVRIDKHSELNDWVTSPRIALRHTVNKALIWRASVATGFRAPEIFDEDFHIEILDDPTRTQNATNLKEEKSLSYSSGVVWTPPQDANRLQVDAEIFHTKISDTFNVSDIVLSGENGNSYKERVNAGGSTVQGFEVNSSYRLSKQFDAEVGVSYVDARFDEAQEVLPGIFESRYLESPKWTGVAKLSYKNENFVDLFLGLVYTGPMIAAREVEGSLNQHTNSFLVLDLTATKHIHWNIGNKELHIDLMFGIKNILDETQPDITAGPDRDTTYFYGPRFPRSIVVQTGVNW